MQIEDKYIIQKCLDGETEAFGFIVDRYRQSVYAFAYSKLRNRQDAEDVTQKVFIKAYQKLRTLKQWDNMHAWLYSITANMCKDWIRVQSRRPDRSFIEDQDPKKLDSLSTESQENDQMIESLNETLESLPEIYRQVLTLYYLGDRDSKEIANFLGISPTSVRQRLARARDLLKEEMITMMSKTFEAQRLPVGFTFRVVESIKRIKIDSISIGKGVPWGLSLATGFLLVVLGLNPQFLNMIQIDLTNLAVSGESSVLETGDFPVDIAKISEEPFLANPEGANNGKSASDNPLIQNAFLLAPQGEGGTWTKKADMSTATGCGGAEVNGKIYIFGGGSSIFAGIKVVEEYDIAKDKWTKKNDRSEVIGFATICSLNEKIYFIGGITMGLAVRGNVSEYNPVTDTWTEKASIIPRHGLSSCVLNGKIYAIGGDTGAGNWSNIVEEYDPNTDKWTRKKDMLVARSSLISKAVNGKIYAISGQAGVSLATVEEYDPITDSWKMKTSMSIPRMYPASAVVDGKIYVLGGYAGDPNWFGTSAVEVYDPATDTWEKKADMPTVRVIFCAEAVNGIIYAIGGLEKYIGLANPSSNAYSTVEAYDTGTFKQPSSVSPKDKATTTWGEVKK